MGFVCGVNLPYFFGAYGRDLALNALLEAGPLEVDPMGIYRPIVEAREIGFEALRVWLCEGCEGLLVENGEVAGVHPVLIESVAIIQECAHLCGVKLYWTLLDGHSWERTNDTLTRSILADPDQTARFAERVAAPLARRLEPSLTLAIEVVNAPETLTAEGPSESGRVPIPWDALGRAIRIVGGAARAERGTTLVTAGASRRALPLLWRSGAGLTALDVHLGHADARLPSRDELAQEVQDPRVRERALPLVAGCVCDPQELASTDRRSAPLESLPNAEREGYLAAFLGRLEGDYIDTTTPARPLTPLARAMQALLASRRAFDGWPPT